jgi:hypothetical protein
MASKKEKGLLWQIEETLEVVAGNIAQDVMTTVERMVVLGVMTIVTGIEIEVKVVIIIIAVGENQAGIRIMIDVTRGKMKAVVMVEIVVMINVKTLVIEAEVILRVVIDILGMIEIKGENDRLEGKARTNDLNVVWLTESRRLWERRKESRMVGAMRCPR